MDMRIFSDTPRDRPVFDAYPMPAPNPQPYGTYPDANGMFVPGSNDQAHVNRFGINSNGNNGFPPNGGGLQVPSQVHPSGNSPFTFPVDAAQQTDFPQFDPRTFASNQTPQLDPAVESILASYFPQAQNPSLNGNIAGANQAMVPDDFLSKVFNFGWDNPQQPNSNGQYNGTGSGGSMDGVIPGATYNGWNAHGWMA